MMLAIGWVQLFVCSDDGGVIIKARRETPYPAYCRILLHAPIFAGLAGRQNPAPSALPYDLYIREDFPQSLSHITEIFKQFMARAERLSQCARA